MLRRRDFLLALTACATTAASLSRRSHAESLFTRLPTLDELIGPPPRGAVTLLHLPDLHAQLLPLYLQEPPSPELTQTALQAAGISPRSAQAYALTPESFEILARFYGQLGGVAHLATVIKAVRDQAAGRTLLIDGGDSWQGSYGALASRGGEMIPVMQALGIDAMTGHWEFTYGAERLQELIAQANIPFLAANVSDRSWNEPIFPSTAFFSRGGVQIAVIGQAYPYTPIANPAYLTPDWSFGLHEDRLRAAIAAARQQGAQVVVVASHNGLDIDRKLAERVRGIDVLLSGHTHEALPTLGRVGDTVIVAAGSHGKFLGRLDFSPRPGGGLSDVSFRLIPILSVAIPADLALSDLISELRRPYQAQISQVLAHTDGPLSRRGTLNGSFDDLLCDALQAYHQTDIAFSPGFRWGPSLLAGSAITREDLYAQTAITYPNSYRRLLSGAEIRAILEDVADNLFHPDPYYRQGGDMVRTGGLSYRLYPQRSIGKRIEDLRLIRTDSPLKAETLYSVAGWASVQQPIANGPPMWEVAEAYLSHSPLVHPRPRPGGRLA